MKVTDVMTENVFTVTPDTPLTLVAVRMLEYGIRARLHWEGRQ